MLTGSAQSRKRNFAQRELGIIGGGSYYIGDLNPRGHFMNSKPSVGIFYRQSFSYRYALRAGFNYGQIGADDSKSKEADQVERNLNFVSNLYEFHALAEFNFVEYRIGSKDHRFSMYVFGGLAAYYFNPKSNIGNGMESLRTYNTEGQSESYRKIQMSVPFGVGFKMNLGSGAGLSMEWGPRRTFTDYLDDVSGSYPANMSQTGNTFTNRSLNGSAKPGSMRGNPGTRDWYFYYGISLNFKLREAHRPCYKTG